MLLLGSLPAAAQVKFGIKGGLDLTKISSDKSLFNNRVGWFIGPTVKLSLPAGLGFDIAALYNQRESEFDMYHDNGSGGMEKYKNLKTKQVIIPLNLRYSIGLGSLISVFGFAGPQVAFNVGDKSQKLSELRDEVAEWRLKDSNFSVNLGLGITLDKLQLSANYNLGLGNTGEVTFRDAADAAYDALCKGKYNAWQISMAYFF